MSKKKLDTTGIENELRGASLFFSRPQKPEYEDTPLSQEKAQVQKVGKEAIETRTGEHPNTRTPEQANARTGERPHTRTGERTISRQSYNVFDDQHQALKRLEAEASLSGQSVFKSEMVREALDDYLRKKGRRTPEHPHG